MRIRDSSNVMMADQDSNEIVVYQPIRIRDTGMVNDLESSIGGANLSDDEGNADDGKWTYLSGEFCCYFYYLLLFVFLYF